MAAVTPESKYYDKWMASRTKHGGYLGGTESPAHYVWRSMMARCYRPTDKSYKYYGARGITVCDAWHDYTVFVHDMGEPPNGMSLDRIDVNGPYCKTNCRWATSSTQQKNKSTTRLYVRSPDMFTGTLVECAKLVGISKELAWYRWKNWGTFIKGETWHELQKAL